MATPARLPAEASSKSSEDFAVALRLAGLLREHPLVQSVAVGGSVARGIGDEFSDLDLFVYCSEFPDTEELLRYLQPARPQRWKAYSGHAADGAREGRLRRRQHRGRPEPPSCFNRRGVPPRGPGEAQTGDATAGLRRRVRRCDSTLWQHLARQVAGPCARLPRHAGEKDGGTAHGDRAVWVPGIEASREGDRLVLYEAVCRVQRALLGVLVGLNHRYPPPEYKRTRAFLASLRIKPEAAAERFESCFQLPPGRVDSQLRGLVHETYDLVGIHMPDLDVEEARQRFTLNPSLAAPAE